MPAKQGVTNEVHDTFSMAKAMIETMTGFYDDMHVDDPAVKARAIFVDTMNVRATDFDLDRDTQQKLYDKDRTAALKFLDGGDGQVPWDWDQYAAKYRSAAIENS